MFKSNLRLFIRNFHKDKTFAIINTFGLVIGILVTLLTSFYALYQLSYDRFVKDYKNIFRIEYVENQDGNRNHYAGCSESLANILKDEVPGVKDVMILSYVGFSHELYCEGKTIKLDNDLIVTPNYLDYFDVQFIQGSKDNFDSKSSLLITESYAEKYFPDNDALGKELMYNPNNDHAYTICGIINDFPPNTHLKASAIELQSSYWKERENIDHYKASNLIESYDKVYLILEDNVAINQVLSYFPTLKKKYLSSYLKDNHLNLELKATNIAKTHFQQDLILAQPTQNINSIYFFLLIATIVIIVSIINFVNLSLARQTERNVDVGIRKTFGVTKWQIFTQHLSESFFFIIGCFVISLLLFYYLLPYFADYNGLILKNARFSSINFGFTISLFLAIAIIASLYPALVISNKDPISLFKGKEIKQKHTGRRIFLAAQIILSIIIFITTLVIFFQKRFIDSTDKGYNLENVIAYEYFNMIGLVSSDEICEKLEKSSYIVETAVSTRLPGQDIEHLTVNVDLPEHQLKVETEFYHINEDYFPFMAIQLVAGRNYDREIASDLTKFIVNESFAKSFANPENAIGTRIYLTQSENNSNIDLDGEIIGVVKDYYFQSMHQKISPLVLTISEHAPNYFHIKYDPQNLKYVLEHSNKIFDELASMTGFTAQKHFPEEELLRKYESEKNLSQITIWLSGLSILLAILGIFGLTAFLIKSNIKMLCIRKVLGADKQDLFNLMFKEYMSVLFVSNVIALPVAWYIGTKWLERFAYHISLPIWLFVCGIIMSLIIVLVAICYHVQKVSSTDPVVYLTDE